MFSAVMNLVVVLLLYLKSIKTCLLRYFLNAVVEIFRSKIFREPLVLWGYFVCLFLNTKDKGVI